MEIGQVQYHIRQCTNEECRFRFPAAANEGLVCPVCKSSTNDFPLPYIVHRETAVATQTNHHIEILVDNIRSIHNVGAIFRTADGAGVKHLHLCGITATPDNHKLAKTALGSEHHLSWSYHRNGLDTAVALKGKGYQLWALEEAPQARSLYHTNLTKNTAPILLIIGNENIGIDPAILQECDQLVALPMLGLKDSLNVAVAFGIALYHLTFAISPTPDSKDSENNP